MDTKKLIVLVAIIAITAVSAMAQYGIKFGDLEVDESNASDIFGNGTAAYYADQNVLVLREGFEFHLSKNFVSFETGRDIIIRLEGDAEIVASVDCIDNLYIEGAGSHKLTITSNISGSALKCPNLTIENGVTLNLLSRNSQNDMYALDCAGMLTVKEGNLKAEVTTARMAVAAESMVLEGCWMKKPKGGGINSIEGGICYADGVPAKEVHITVEGFSIEENQDAAESVRKVFENGTIVIIKDGRRYNLNGQLLQNN